MLKVLIITLISIAGSFNQLIAQTKSKKVTATKSPAILPTILANGKLVYNKYCLTCHMADGGGVPNMNPPLSKTSYVLGDKSRLISVILNGLATGEEIDGEIYTNVMPAHNFLKDQEIADVLTYIRNNFGNKAGIITPAEVKMTRGKKNIHFKKS